MLICGASSGPLTLPLKGSNFSVLQADLVEHASRSRSSWARDQRLPRFWGHWVSMARAVQHGAQARLNVQTAAAPRQAPHLDTTQPAGPCGRSDWVRPEWRQPIFQNPAGIEAVQDSASHYREGGNQRSSFAPCPLAGCAGKMPSRAVIATRSSLKPATGDEIGDQIERAAAVRVNAGNQP